MTDKETILAQYGTLPAALGPDAYELGKWAFDEIRAGLVPTVKEAARSLGWSEERARGAIGALVSRSMITLAPDGATITGSLGLSRVPTQHKLRLDGRDLYVWCAVDAVGIPAALRSDATVRSQTDDGQPVHIEFRRGEIQGPGQALDISLTTVDADSCFADGACLDIRFYAKGLVPLHPHVAPIALEEAARLGRAIWGTQ